MSQPPNLEQESAILKEFQKHKTNNPKKIVKLANKLYNEAKYEIQKKLCLEIINAADPVKYLDYCINRIYDFAIIMEEELTKGNHGVIFTGPKGDIIFPIKLKVLEHWINGDKWNEEDEYEILLQSVTNFMESNNRKSIKAKALLFPKFGFSGIPRMFEISKKDTQ